MNETLRTRFSAANWLLKENRPFWTATPFKQHRMPWEADHPALSRALRGLSEHELLEYEAHPARARRFLARWLPRIADRAARLEPDELPVRDASPVSTPHEGIPARKWEQIRRFAERVPRIDLPILEWCSGKGHLGRLLSKAGGGTPVRCIERDERLAHAGREIAEELSLPIDFAVMDALRHDAEAEVREQQLACALHACGQLHVRLMDLAVRRGTLALAISPCCYHLVEDEQYEALSQAARNGGLAPTRDELRLAVQETVTAAPAVRRRRETLASWRLGFDMLQREIRGVDAYLNVPPAPDRLARGTFAGFARWAADRRQVDLPVDPDFNRYEAVGRQRLAEVRRLNVVRHLFRRPLEMWLVLDRGLFLSEHGYRVEVGTFCQRRVTPRNLLIRATR